MGFKCVKSGYDISDKDCGSCNILCEFNHRGYKMNTDEIYVNNEYDKWFRLGFINEQDKCKNVE